MPPFSVRAGYFTQPVVQGFSKKDREIVRKNILPADSI
ncbi:Uncharacterised protein [Yersinia similis]|nr:Uncharacterised protein [Yersinia similis]